MSDPGLELDAHAESLGLTVLGAIGLVCILIAAALVAAILR